MIAGIAALVIVVCILVYFFLLMPNVSNPADMETLRQNYAHRGLWNEQLPENSLAAFAYAVRWGYGIELDVQLSRDQQLMVFHDADLKRMCGVNRRVSDLTCAELKALRLAGTDQTIPTLAEVLQLVKGRVPLMIEIKGEKADVALCVRLTRLLDSYRGAFCVISFSPLILNWFKNYRPCYARGQLVPKMKKPKKGMAKKGSRFVTFLLSHMLTNVISRPDFISVEQSLRKRPSVLFCTRALHLPCFSWTVRTPEEFRNCRRFGSFAVFERIRPKAAEPKQSGVGSASPRRR